MAFDKAKAIRAAEKYLAQGKLLAAIQEYLRIVENDREDFTALNTLGDLYARVNQRLEAVACYRRVAEHYREQGFALKAVAMYKKVTRFDADDPRTSLALASLYEQQGLTADARAQYLAAADAFARADDAREALNALRRIADLDPADVKVRLRLAEGYARQDMPDEAAEAYTASGERLAARGEHEAALDAFARALAQKPAFHAALSGLLGAHVALGTPAEAAEALEQAAEETPLDPELRAMLTRAYIEAGDARNADRSTEDLARLDAASYTVVFDVARLYLQQDGADDAARLLGRISEQALAGGQGAALLELLQGVLAREPEHLAALGLLVRLYAWQREDERLRSALERLVEAARSASDPEEERKALAQLARLAPDDLRYAARLDELGGPAPEDDPASRSAPADALTFESFVLQDEETAAVTPYADAAGEAVSEFEWNAVGGDPSAAAAEDAETVDAGAEFGFSEGVGDGHAGDEVHFAGFHEVDFGDNAVAVAEAGEGGGEQMLLQELESVDFYIEQNYADIARETLDVLERQYGAHAEIERRRALLHAADVSCDQPGPDPAFAGVPQDAPAFDFTTLAPTADADAAAGANGNGHAHPAASPAPGPERSRPVAAAGGGIDPGLAAIFDEFRESVEADQDDRGGDFDTHYQMGLAYSEMGLLDHAVEEFQAAAALCAPGDGTPRFLNCCNLLGHCFVQKGLPRPATVWFRKGLGAPGHGEDEYQALRYELASAYEQLGDTQRAVETFSEVYAIDVSYRGVAERLRDLQNSVSHQS